MRPFTTDFESLQTQIHLWSSVVYFFLAQCATNTYRLKFNFFVTETLEMHEVILIMATQGIEQKIMGFMGWGVQFVQSFGSLHLSS